MEQFSEVDKRFAILIEKVHAQAEVKGWWDEPKRSSEEIRMLILTEIAEATEAVRKNLPPICAYEGSNLVTDVDLISKNSLKPEGEAVELADAVIRIFDYFGHKGWSMHPKTHTRILSNFDKPLNAHLELCRFITLASSDTPEERFFLEKAVYGVEEYFIDNGWSFWETLYLKHKFNKTRTYRHGGKAF